MAAIFFDIDGTLLDRYFHIEKSTKEGIRQLKKNGHRVYINSGRSKVYINHEEMLSLGFDGISSGCGTNIFLHGKEVLYHPMSLPLMYEVLSDLYQMDIPMILEGRDWLFMDKEKICTVPYGERLYHNMIAHIQPLRGNEVRWQGTKMCGITAGKDLQPLEEKYSGRLYFIDHDAAVMEAIPEGFSKATAIEKICSLTGADIHDTYAFGDGTNDVEMLTFAGHGIAMGNARKPAKEAADYVTDDIHDDGIYKALEHFGLI